MIESAKSRRALDSIVSTARYSDETQRSAADNDTVNHPNHYISASGLEAIDVIKAFTEGLDGYEAVATGNVIKYILRWKKKNGLEDLKKAQWYLTDLINYIYGEEEV